MICVRSPRWQWDMNRSRCLPEWPIVISRSCVRMVRIGVGDRQWVQKDRRGLLERNAMRAQVDLRLLRSPFINHRGSLPQCGREAERAVNPRAACRMRGIAKQPINVNISSLLGTLRNTGSNVHTNCWPALALAVPNAPGRARGTIHRTWSAPVRTEATKLSCCFWSRPESFTR